MALPNSKIIQNNGALSNPAPSKDGIAALVMGGVAVAGTIVLGTVYTIYSLKEAEALGITDAYDTTNLVAVYTHIKDFYENGAQEGQELRFMIVAQATTMAQMLDKNNNYAAKILADSLGDVKLLAVHSNPAAGYVANIVEGFDDDVWAAAAKAMELRAAEFTLHRYCSYFIAGRAFSGNAATAKDLRHAVTGLNANRVTIAINADPDVYARGGQVAKYAAVGLVLGRAARIPVQRNVGRVKDGKVYKTKAGLSSAAAIESYTDANITVLHDKGYVFLRRHTNRAGYYFNDDHVACPLSDDYRSLSAGRVMDKASRIVRDVYVEEINDDVELDPATGKMQPAVLKGYQAEAQTAIESQMQAAGEISGVGVTVDPNQDIQSTQEVKTVVKLVQKGYSKTITSTLTFTKSLN